MPVNQTIWVLQWDRYTSMAKSQNAPALFWEEYKKIKIPSDGQITEVEITKLRSLMAAFQLSM